VLVVGVLAFIATDKDVYDVPFLEAAAELGYAVVIMVVVSRRFGLPRPKIDFAAWRATLRQSLPLLVSAVARATVLAFDLFLLELMKGPSKVGFYGAALKPVLTILGVLGLLSVTFLSSFSATDGEEAAHLFRRTTRIVALGSLPVAIALSAGSVVIVPLIYGGGYDPSVVLLATLAWVVPLSALIVTYGSVLIAAEHQVALMWINIAAACVYVAGDLVAIPLFGAKGAAVVRIVTACVTLALMYRVSVRRGLALALADVLQPLGRQREHVLAARPERLERP
jgi:O-antigen/teichoic acid export membrane protein